MFTFVTERLERALAAAQQVAVEKRIGLVGANIDQQFLAAGLGDEIRIHLIDVLPGGASSTSSRSESSRADRAQPD